MVTLQEARVELDKAKQELGMQQDLAQAKQLEIQSVQLPQVPQRQLQTRGIMDMIKRRIMGQNLEQQKTQALAPLTAYQQQFQQRKQEVSQYGQELSVLEQQQAALEAQQSEYEYGRKLGLRGAPPIGLSAMAKEGYRNAAADIQAYEARKGALQETMTTQELGPIYQTPPSTYAPVPTQLPREYASGTAMNYNVPEAPQFTYDKTTGQFTEVPKVNVPGIFEKGYTFATKTVPTFIAGIPSPSPYSFIDKAKAGDIRGALGYPGALVNYPSYDSTIGQEAEKFSVGLSRGRELISQVTTKIINLLPGEQRYTKTIPERNVPIYKTETGIYNPTTGEYESPSYYTLPEETRLTPLGYIPAVAGIVPEVAGYIAAPEFMFGTDIAVAGQKIKDVEKVVDIEMQKQFQNLDPATVPEGYRNPTWEEFNTEENRAQLRSNLISGYQLQAGISEVFLGGTAAVKLGRDLFKPIVQTREYNPYSKVREVSWGDKGRYKILTVQRLPEVRVTNKFREFFGMNPKIGWTPIGRASPLKGLEYPSKVYQTQPILGRTVSKTKPYLTETKFIGKGPTEKSYSIIIPKGSATDIDLKLISQLPKAEKRVALKALAEGRLFPTTKFSASTLDVVNIKRLGTGKSKTSYFAFNRMDVDPFRVSSKGELYKTITTFKDTTTPFYRAAGRVPRLRGELLVLSEPPVPTGITFTKDVIKTESGAGFWKSFISKTKTPLESTFAIPSIPTATKQITMQIAKQIPLVTIPKAIPIVKSAVPLAITKGLQKTALTSLVTGVKATTALRPLIKVKTESLSASLIAVKPIERTKIITDVITDTITKPKPFGITKTISAQIEVPKQIMASITIPIVKTITIPKSTITPRTTLVVTPRTPRPPTLKVPRLKIPIIKPEETIPKSIKRKRIGLGLFIPEVRRKGTFQAVSKPTSLWGAVEIGKRKVKETLGASLRVKEARTGRIVPLEPFGMFAPSKRETGVLVQVRGARLGTRSERKEIQAARRSAKWWK